MSNYNPVDWYWTATDGRVFSSRKQAILGNDDADFAAWSRVNRASPWPRDASGFETNAALQEVVGPFGVFADLTAYAKARRYEREVGGVTVDGKLFATDDRSKTMIMGARIAAGADAKYTTPWATADGTVVTLNAAAIIAMSNTVLDHVQTCFAVFASVAGAIEAGTITSTAEVDSAFAAV